jgi:hypothetical protein
LAYGFNNLKLQELRQAVQLKILLPVKFLKKLIRKKLPIRGEWKDNNFFGILEEEFNNTG